MAQATAIAQRRSRSLPPRVNTSRRRLKIRPVRPYGSYSSTEGVRAPRVTTTSVRLRSISLRLYVSRRVLGVHMPDVRHWGRRRSNSSEVRIRSEPPMYRSPDYLLYLYLSSDARRSDAHMPGPIVPLITIRPVFQRRRSDAMPGPISPDYLSSDADDPTPCQVQSPLITLPVFRRRRSNIIHAHAFPDCMLMGPSLIMACP